MPAPRAAQGHRKSVVPDPDLYADSDGSDAEPEDARPPPKRSRTTSATPADSAAAAAAAHKGLVRKGSKGPQPVRGSVTSDAGRRRSTRLSNEGAPDPPPAATHHGKARGTKPTRKRTKERDSDDEHAAAAAGDRDAPHHDDDQGEDDNGGRSMHPPRPRAAADLAARVHKPPPAYSTALVDPDRADDADDAEPFLFTTNPPTPYAKATAAQRAAAASAKKPGARGKAPRTDARNPSHDAAGTTAAEELAAGPSTAAPGHRRRRTPPRENAVPAVPVHVHETPVQVRNIAFRQGLPPGTPATIARTARRSSARGSGKRGSSIGGGFEAVPHPQVADDKLYRSTDASDPIAKRLRSIVSWAAQRTRDRMFRSIREDEMGPAQTAAKGVVDAFIEDVCSLRVDTSVPYQDQGQSQDPSRLPPHPHNESNASKMQELEDSYAAIAREQELRQSLEPTYQSFFDARTQAHAEASTSYASLLPAAARSNPSAYAATLDLSVSAPTSLKEALALGRRVMRGELVRSDGGKTPARKTVKGKGKLAADEADEATTPQEVMQRRVAEAQLETADFRHRTHRLAAFSRVAAAYIAHRSAETHAALARHTELGATASSTAATAAAAAGGADDGSGHGASGAGLAQALPTSASAAAAAAAAAAPAESTHLRGVDSRDLLRAIADADTKRRG
ncbi:hypothetical protein JCM8202v2_004146 [Rhodotorula sphaerocarpa]